MANKPPPRRVILFHPRFWEPIRAGSKRQTIRAPRKRPVPAGAILSLRGWTDKPYRSKQITLQEATCVGVEPIRIEIGEEVEIEIAGVRLNRRAVCNFMRADGFESSDNFRAWWADYRYTPFEGILIRWEYLS